MLSEDQKRILGYFIEEAKDHLNTIEQGLLNLQATIEDAEMVNEVFRAAHSVKGGAAMLGLNSIQRASHRLEDFFKMMKESPLQADRDLESMLLQIFDGLQELLEQLQGPYGLSDEQAEEVLATLEPVFTQTESHLQHLIESAPATPKATATPAPAAASAPAAVSHPETSALQLVFQSDVPALLRDMLATFKKPDQQTTRQELEQICQRLRSIGEQFELSQWCELIGLAQAAVMNEQQTFRALAPVIIKDIKRGQDLVLADNTRQIEASADLQAMVPEEPQVMAEDDSTLDALLAEALDDSSTGEPDLADLFAAAESEATAAELPAADDSWLEDVTHTEMDDVDDLEAAFDSLTAEVLETGPGAENRSAGVEVGAAELNSLADLFEGDPAGLEAVWEEEEFAESDNGTGNHQDDSPDLESDLADLLGTAEMPNHASAEADDDDLISLFGQSLDDAVTADASASAEAELELPEPTPAPEVEDAEPALASASEASAAENLDDFFAVDDADSAAPQATDDFDEFFEAEPEVVSHHQLAAIEVGSHDEPAVTDSPGPSSPVQTAESASPADEAVEPTEQSDSGTQDTDLDALFGAAETLAADADNADITGSFDALLEGFPADEGTDQDGSAIDSSAAESEAADDTMFDGLDFDDFEGKSTDEAFPLDDLDNALTATEQNEAVDESTLPEAEGDADSDPGFDLDLDFEDLEDAVTGAQGLSEEADLADPENDNVDSNPDAAVDEPDLPDDMWASAPDAAETTPEAPDFDLGALEEDGDFLNNLEDSAPEGDGAIAAEIAELNSAPVPAALDDTLDFDELDNLLDDQSAGEPAPPSTDADDDNFDDLEALLEDSDHGPTGDGGATPAQDNSSSADDDDDEAEFDEFSDLEKLLEDTDQLGGSSPGLGSRRASAAPAARRAPRRAAGVTDQTMRVSVSHLDILSNLVGELVVNRNSLEQDQERLRQFLDNLLLQVQQLNDVGQRMRDLYERSLLESSLISSRQAMTASASSNNGGNSHATGATFDALEMDRFTGFHTLSQEMIELIVRVREAASDIEFTVDSSDQITRQFRQVTTQLQEGLNKARMVPFGQTADRLPRAVRDISLKCGREAKLVVEGRDTLIDKMILERLYDPVTHLVNNAITHGIEPPDEREARGKSREGTITIRAFYQGNQTVIYIADDGGGINPGVVKEKALKRGLISPAEAASMSDVEVYDLLFLPGFSTRDQADDFSGRGVGMDVVRTALADIRGAITIESLLGQGTSFTIRLPLTLSITKALSCVNNQARIAFPMDGVEDMFDVPKERIQTNEKGVSCILWRDTLLPFRPLSELLQFNRSLGRGRVYGGSNDDNAISIVVLRSASTFIGLQVDQVIGEQEIVIKQLEGPVPKPTGIAGATVMGDGRVMPIADVLELIDLSLGRVRREPATSLWGQAEEEDTTPMAVREEPTVLIVDDSITVRELLSMSFNKVGYRVEQARDGQEAWEKLRSGLPCDLVFCDIEMPRMDGLELLSRLQKDEQLNRIPIAMLTSRGADRHRQMAVDLGASGYFTKPYLEEMLLDAAQRMLNGENMIGVTAAAETQEA